ncbi:hypothetical protein PG993_006927 [Apiospora rasikravindrae]|uniref:F-box domain-containing protein n=1 Tax=Apiospora rasikravindrae TaxID=990691 RepID=A0ABR1SW16_9PEZI
MDYDDGRSFRLSRPTSLKSERRASWKSKPGDKRDSLRVELRDQLRVIEKRNSLNSITPTSGLEFLVRRGVEGLHRVPSPVYDEDGNLVPHSPLLRGAIMPLESIADRMREKWEAANGAAADPNAPSRLMALPLELHYMIIDQLRFGDVERLRRTCRFYHDLLTPDFVRDLFGGPQALASQFAGVCQVCHYMPDDEANETTPALILQPGSHPLASKCFRCSVQNRELHVGDAVVLANAGRAWVCRWCGWPVVGGTHSWASEQFHGECYERYYRVLWCFLLLGFAQFSVGVVAGALSLAYFRQDLVVFVPAVINFVLLWVCMAFLVLRGNYVRTYHWVALVELTILGLWIPPLYMVAKDLDIHLRSPIRAATIAALVFFTINMLFRLLNCIGNVFLMFEYNITKHYMPEIPLRRRMLNYLITGLIYWTYPQCVEQKYPPDFN